MEGGKVPLHYYWKYESHFVLEKNEDFREIWGTPFPDCNCAIFNKRMAPSEGKCVQKDTIRDDCGQKLQHTTRCIKLGSDLQRLVSINDDVSFSSREKKCTRTVPKIGFFENDNTYFMEAVLPETGWGHEKRPYTNAKGTCMSNSFCFNQLVI